MKIQRSDPAEIKKMLTTNEAFTVGIRLYIVYLVALGHSSRKLSEIHNISFKQITNWVHRFENEGIEGLKDRKGRGRRSILSDKDMQKIKTIILTEKPEKYGFKSNRWTGPLLRELISHKYGVCYQKAQIYNLLRKIGVRFEKKKGLVEAD
ncbi:MAG: helix-turn-helix domain-containing protein [bacterium]